MRISREPALYLALFAAVVQLGATFGLDLSSTQQGLLNGAAAAVAGVLVALFVKRDGGVPALLGLLQAALATAVGFGLHLSPEQQLLIMTTAGALAAVFTRTQVLAPVGPEGEPR